MTKTDKNKIPNNWKVTNLGSVAKVLNGSTPSTKNPSYWDGAIGWITPKDLSQYNKIFIDRGNRNISEIGLVHSSARMLPKNTVLFSSRAPIGYVAIASIPLTTNQGFKNIVCDEHNLHFKFIYYWLMRNGEYIERLSSGSTFSEATATLMRDLTIQLPPLTEQKAIAIILTSLDDKIELLRRQNKTLEKIAQTIFKEWFVEFNFPDKYGKPYKSSGGKLIDSELGAIPEGWRVGKLSDEFEIIMGQSPPGSSYNQTKDGEVFFQGRTDFGERFPKTRLYTTNPKRMAEAFDVLVSVRAPVGDINVASESCCIGRGLGAVRGKYRSYTLYKVIHLQDELRAFEAEGTVFGSIGKNDFNSVVVIIPDQEFVSSFDGVVAHMDEKILNNHNQIQTLTKLRDTLLPRLMSGQVRI
jgi:type I restriction enzyme S subunit